MQSFLERKLQLQPRQLFFCTNTRSAVFSYGRSYSRRCRSTRGINSLSFLLTLLKPHNGFPGFGGHVISKGVVFHCLTGADSYPVAIYASRRKGETRGFYWGAQDDIGRGEVKIATSRFRMVEPCSSFFHRKGTELWRYLDSYFGRWKYTFP